MPKVNAFALGGMQSRINDVHALTRVYDLLVWVVPVLEKFPRSQRFLVGDRIETGLPDVQDLHRRSSTERSGGWLKLAKGGENEALGRGLVEFFRRSAPDHLYDGEQGK